MNAQHRKGSDLVVVSRQELHDLIRDAVRDALDSQRPAEWLSKAQVAELIGVTTRSVSTYVERDGLPSHRRGGTLRFRRDEVNAWMRGR